MTPFTHFTDDELVRQLTIRDDLTAMEHELLDRLIRALDALADYQDHVPCTEPAGAQVA